MGAFKKIGNFLGFHGGKGVQCTKQQDGSETCSFYEKDGSQLVATGTVVHPIVDPQTCEVALGGDLNRINEEDAEAVNSLIESKKKACQKGIV